MGISVIISNFNGDRYLERLISSLKSQKNVVLEIIVVDRQSQDQSFEILKQHPDVRVVSEPPQSGLVAGYTQGLKKAQYDLLFFCNEDLYLDPECLGLLQAAIDLDKKICAADPWQWDYQGEKWLHGGTRFVKSRWALSSSYVFRDYHFCQVLKTGELIPFACAGAFMIRRQAFEQVGGWDTSFFIDNEDVDLFLRLWQRGWLAVNVPEAKVYHDVGGSAKKNALAINTLVSKKRYLSDWTGKIMIAFKYFSFWQLMLNTLNLFVRFLNNLRHARFKYAFWDMRVVWEIVKRKPKALVYRWQNRKINRKRPGERFFTDPEFQV